MSRVFYNSFATSHGYHNEQYLPSPLTMVSDVSQLPRPPRASNPAPGLNVQEFEQIQREGISWNHERIRETECQVFQKDGEQINGTSRWLGECNQSHRAVDKMFLTQRPFAQDMRTQPFGSIEKWNHREQEERPMLIEEYPRHSRHSMELPTNAGFSFSVFQTDKMKQNWETQSGVDRIFEREESSRVRSEMLESMRLSRISLARQNVPFQQMPIESSTRSPQHDWDFEMPTVDTTNYLVQKDTPYVQRENGQRQWCNFDRREIGNYESSIDSPYMLTGSMSGCEAISNSFENKRELKRQGLPVKERGAFFGGLKAIPTNPNIDPPLYSCFNCWQNDHSKAKCPYPPTLYCYNCGRRGTPVNDCPRCGDIYRQRMNHRDSYLGSMYTDKSNWRNELSESSIADQHRQSPLKRRNYHHEHMMDEVRWDQRMNVPQSERLPIVFGGERRTLQESPKEISRNDEERPSAPRPRQTRWDVPPVMTAIPSAKDARRLLVETKHLPRDTQDAILRVLLGMAQDIRATSKEELQRTLMDVRHLSVELQDQILRAVLSEIKKI